MAQINGTDLVVWFDETTTPTGAIGYGTSCTLTLSLDTPAATTKDSAGWEEVIGGLKSWEISSDHLADVTASANVDTFFDALTNRTTNCNVIFKASGTEFSGSGVVTSFELSGEMESPATLSISIKGNGALTKA